MFPRVAVRTLAAMCRQRVASKLSHRSFSISSFQRTLVRPTGTHSYSPFLQSKRNINIDVLDTPNPKSLKFVPDCPVLGEDQGVSSVVLSNQKEAQTASPFLGYPLLLIEGVSHVMLGTDFVTVTLQEGYEWISAKPQIFQVLTEFSESNKNALVDGWKDTSSQEHPIDPEDEEAVALIKEIIELRVRPSVMEDGGDIEFIKFDENRIVWLLMKGSCSGCPSSGATLKHGIQNMLMHYVPEVEGVEEWVDEKLESVSAAALAKLEASLAEAKAHKSE